MGTNNFLEVKGDSVSADLPYYGERQIAGSYNNRDVGVQFEGLAKDFELSYNDKKTVTEHEKKTKEMWIDPTKGSRINAMRKCLL